MTGRTLGVCLAIAVVGFSSASRAEEPTQVVSPRLPRVSMHSLGAGYHNVVMTTEAGDTYSINGPGVVYDYVIRRRWGFMFRAEIFFPVAGSMSGPSGEFGGSLVEPYDTRRIGVDGLIMGCRYWQLLPELSVTAAAGAHVQSFSLNGTEYSPVETATLGLGGLGKLDYTINSWLSASATLAMGLDFLDLIDHKNPSTLVVPLSVSFAVGARY
jgi:hypothetical protein